MYHRWSWITFIHWRYPPSMLQPMLPPGLTVETFDGSAWVGLTPFLMQGVRTPALPAVPWLSSFPETNLRTYVQDRRGRRGIWFLSLDAARLPAVLAARAGYRLPYYWSNMAVRIDGDQVAYRCARRWPGPRRLRCDADVRLGPQLSEAEHDELAHFLTARYRLFTVIAGRLAAAEAEHPEWPLRRGELLRLDQDLLTGAGLPTPASEPLLHASVGVPVRVGMWHPLDRP
ncbi:YqjF family protein [Micromonospora sp. SL4-19]|uniref:YqjF family protein n=1 Tax=Micromonospora sp. SL4-19 TaxID=3399129 RepID=UPI003A4E391D